MALLALPYLPPLGVICQRWASSRTPPVFTQDELRNLWGHVRNENEALVQKLFRTSRWRQQDSRPSLGPRARDPEGRSRRTRMQPVPAFLGRAAGPQLGLGAFTRLGKWVLMYQCYFILFATHNLIIIVPVLQLEQMRLDNTGTLVPGQAF